MKFTTTILPYIVGAMLANAMPVEKSASELKSTDSDDKVAYTWALPESRKREDSDDKVAYTWAIPEDE
ncbi:hypothetical protein N7478_013301 [Penicillium angulare]|uniref:uncharacterized protein n=1 Tax=Penicillium angulare TaxID=116970 RepID=UPI00253F6C0B|nr:uncharacterized protein N7478_013301 [Penicillium angulare]KAJ5257197.1 hypothetical protein N7478_013301 [Penicillium angulare]